MTPRLALMLFIAGPALGILVQALMGAFKPGLVVAAALVGEAAAFVVAWGLSRAMANGTPGEAFLVGRNAAVPVSNRLFGFGLLAVLALAVAGLALLGKWAIGRLAA